MASAGTDARDRVDAFDWEGIAERLAADGYALLPELLSEGECRALSRLYADEARFRKRVDLAGHGFGEGDYQYFRYPLPPLVAALRSALYPCLAAIANDWWAALGVGERFPLSHRRFLAHCRALGQARPTPLLLRYPAGGYNRLHQDLYGEVAFPLQLTCLLTPRREFEGGEFLLVEQRPRMQSRGHAIALATGEGIVFPTRLRPVPGRRGFSRAQMRHGVSTVRSGERRTLGIIFHDAR